MYSELEKQFLYFFGAIFVAFLLNYYPFQSEKEIRGLIKNDKSKRNEYIFL